MRRHQHLSSMSAIRIGTVGIASALALLTASSAARSEESEQAVSGSAWKLNFTPYGWATWLTGDQTVKGRTVELDIDPINLIEHLDSVPFMGYAEVRKGPIAFYGDVVYAKLGLGADGVRSRSVHPLITSALSGSLGLNFEQTILEGGGAYEIAKWSSGGGSSTAIDVIAGARYWRQEADLQLSLDLSLDVGDLVVSRGIAIARSGSVDWVDPVVGAVIRHQLAPGQDLLLRGDIGGFGVGSQFSWNVLAAYSFEICVQGGVTYSGILGYRLLDVDYEQGSGRTQYEYDVLQHGPLTGLTIAF